MSARRDANPPFGEVGGVSATEPCAFANGPSADMDPQLRDDYEDRDLPPPWWESQVWRSLCVWGVVILLARGLAFVLQQLGRLG